MPTHHPAPINDNLVGRLCDTPHVDLAGSLYAVPATDRAAAAHLLGARGLWIHADVFADADMGVSLDLITRLADDGTGPIDVHLLTAGALTALDVVCRPGIARVTFPYEGTDDIEAVAARVRSVGAQPWLALAPGTPLDQCSSHLAHVDGLLVMLIEPGTRETADLTQLTKVDRVHPHLAAGVDGGVDETNLDHILTAGTGYVVVGRRLFTRSHHQPEGAQR
ncbi:hypothetical protein ACWEK5_30640 [Rhodococcus koreensis]